MNEADPTPPPPLPSQHAPPSPTQQPVQVMSYATRPPSNQAAVLSLVFGLLLFIPFAAPGIVAIILGRRGIKAAQREGAGREGLARAGIILGVLNLVFSVAFAIWTPYALLQARQQAQAVQCMSNLRQLGMMTMMYANANRGAFPPTIDHLATMAPGPRPAAVFVCPACGTDPSKPPIVVGKTVSSHYCFVTPASRLMLVKRPANTVLAYEPPTNHDNRGMNILFCDGHVERITGPAMTKIAAELAAGQNPPPSKK